MATTEQLKLVIDVVNKDALKNVNALTKAAKGLGEELDDTRSAAKKVAAEMERRADEMASDLKAAEKAAEALSSALGPEMAAKIGHAKLDAFVGDLRRAGLSFEEVEADAESFAQALRKMDAAADSVKNVDSAMARVGDTADNTRSVVANFTGNAISELPGVAGAFGPLNMAIGQFTEYATEGNIALGSFLKAAGPIAVVAMGVKLFSDAMEENAQRAAEYKKRVEALTAALRDARESGMTAAQALAKSWADNGGKIEAEISNDTATLLEFGEATDDMGKIHELVYPTAKRHVEDFSDELAAMGVSGVRFAELAGKSADEIRLWGDEMVAAGFDAAEVNKVMQGAIGLQLELADAAKADAVFMKVFGGSVKEVSSAHEALITKYEMAADAADRAESSLQEYYDTMRASVDASFALFDAQNDLTSSLETLASTTDDPKTAVNELDIATKDAAESAFNLADAQVAQADAAAKAAGKTLTAAEKNDILVGSLQATADQLAPGSPLRQQLEMYIAALKRVPPSISTALNIVGGTASRSGLLGQAAPAHASGTSSAPGGMTLVGEQGPELVNLPRGASVMSHGMTQQLMQSSGAPGIYVGSLIVQPRTMPTERELIDLINGIRRKQGGVI